MPGRAVGFREAEDEGGGDTAGVVEGGEECEVQEGGGGIVDLGAVVGELLGRERRAPWKPVYPVE